MNMVKRGRVCGRYEERYVITMDIDINKVIDHIEMRISGWDSSGGDFYGAIRDITFLGASK